MAVGRLSDEQRAGLEKIAKNRTNSARIKSQQLDKDSFLRLTMEQLKNQNPLSPVDNKDMIAQMAQFSSIEQMTNMVSKQSEMATLSQTMTAQLEKMTSLLTQQSASSSGLTENILTELRTISTMLNQYLAATPKEKEQADSAILSVIEG